MATKNKEEELYEYYDENLENQAQSVQDYYNMAREQRYTDLLNQEIEMENSKQNALKYTQNQLANQGFDSQGYGSSVQAGIYNNYANNIAQAQSDYSFDISGKNYEEQQQLNNIRLQDSALKQENQNAQYDQILSLISGASSKENMDKYLNTFGYENIMTNKPEGMSDYQWNMMKLAYEEKNNQIEMANSYTGDELKEQNYITPGGKEKKVGNDFNKLTSTLINNANNNEYNNGDVISLIQNGKYLYLKYNNGRFSIISKKEYNDSNDENKYYISYVSNTFRSGQGTGQIKAEDL